MSALLLYIATGILCQWVYHLSVGHKMDWFLLLWIALWPLSVLINVIYWTYELGKFLTKRGERKGEQ